MCDSQKECSILKFLENERYAFSTILSFLSECEGTSTLITNKSWARLVLPIYYIPLHLLMKTTDKKGIDSVLTQGNPKVCSSVMKQKRHKFIVVPVQDPRVLLDRLNTVRLAKRVTFVKKRKREKQEEKTINSKNINICYPRHMTTDEIAWYEWHVSSKPEDNTSPKSKIWPANLELLRYRKPITPTLILKQPQTSRPDILPGVTLLASYPRSGNTLLRNLLERTLNVVVGSDTRPDRTLSKALALQHNLVGEGLVSPSITPIIKTHFPERRGYKVFNASRVILLVRNPYDAIDSYWNMCCTNTHTESVVEDIYKVYAEKFRGLVKSEIRTWMDFLKHYVLDDDVVERTRLPTLIVRYEDLILDTKSVMEEVMKFLLYGENIEGRSLHPFWEWRVHHSLNVTANKKSVTSPHQMGERIDVNIENGKGSSSDVSDSFGIDMMTLGSYQPRPISEDGSKVERTAKDTILPQPPKSDRKTFLNRGTISSIGKSIKKKRYSDDIIRHIHDVAHEKKYLIGNGDNCLTLLRLFGYDILHDHFPLNFSGSSVRCLPSLLRGDSKYSSMKVNVGKEIRPMDDPFGRAMTKWRRGETDEDKKPFPTITRD